MHTPRQTEAPCLLNLLASERCKLARYCVRAAF